MKRLGSIRGFPTSGRAAIGTVFFTVAWVAAFTALSVAPGLVGQTAPARVASPLPPLDGDAQSEANAINAAGQVAGISFGPGPRTAVVWDGEGSPTPLRPLPGDSASEALGINSAGIVVGCSGSEGVVGCSDSEDGAWKAVMWGRDGEPVELPPLTGQTRTVARSINDAGVVVGLSGPDGAAQAVIWSGEGDPIVLPGLPGDPESDARAINTEGVVVGLSKGPSGESAGQNEVRTAMIWDAGGHGTVLPPLPGRLGSVALAINGVGVVAGESYTAEGVFTATLWARDGIPTGLALPPGEAHSTAWGVTTSGLVLGWTYPHSGWVWDAGGVAHELPPLPGDVRSKAFGINDAGQAVGHSASDAIHTAVIWR